MLRWIPGALALLATSFISNAAFADCVMSNQDLVVSPTEAVAGQKVQVTYSATRETCSGLGSFSYDINVGSGTSGSIGSCEGKRTSGSESCTGEATLPAGFTGSINIVVKDTSARVNVSAPLDVPAAPAIAITTPEDQPYVIDMPANGVDYASYEVAGQPHDSQGSAFVDGKTIIFTPVRDWNGTGEFSYRSISAQGVQSDVGTITFEVTPVPDAPVLSKTALIGVEDRPLTFEPVVTDPDKGDTYTLFVDQQPDPSVGVVTVDGAKVTFTPAKNWNGDVEFALKAVDSFGISSEPQYYKATIESENDAPEVSPVKTNILEDEPASVPVVFNDPDGSAPFTIFIHEQPAAGGVCSISGTEVLFKPATDWSGSAVCVVAVADASGAVGTGKYTFAVAASNDAPSSQDIHVTFNQGTSKAVLVSVSDPDAGDTHTVEVVTPVDPTFGAISVSGKTITLAPVAGYYGFKKVTYRVRDNHGAVSSDYAIYAKVIPVNKAPVMTAQEFTTPMGQSFSTRVSAIDPNQDAPLTFSISASPAAGTGTAALSGDVLTYTPAAGFTGVATVQLQARDPGGLLSAAVPYKFNVTGDVPVAIDVDLGMPSDSHTLVIVEQPPAGVGSIAVSGSKVTLTPVKGFFGKATFKYKVVDAAGASTGDLVGTIDVAKYNYAPTSASASISVVEGKTSSPVQPVVVDENPYDAGKHTFIVPIQTMAGFVEVVNNKLVYTAPFGYSGTDSFKFLAVDQGGLSVVGTATVSIKAFNYAPDSVSGAATGPEGVSLSAPLVVVDKNAGETFTYEILEQPHSGSASLSGSKLVFTPAAGFVGKMVVPVRATDAGGLSVDGYVVFTVEKNNVAPTSVSGIIKVYENGVSAPFYPKVADANLYDYGRHVLTVSVAPAFGQAEVVGNRITYTPNKNFSGADQLTVRAVDLGGLAVVGKVDIEVIPYNTAPLATEALLVAYEGESSRPTWPSVEDPNAWDAHTFEVISQPSHGEVVLTAEGFVYTPKAKFYGVDSFPYRAVDAAGDYVDGVARVIVYRKNYAPTGFAPQDFYFYEGVGGSLRLAAEDPNLWGTHTFTVAQQPEHGEVVVRGNTLVFRTQGKATTQMLVTVTDQAGESFTGTLNLIPRPIGELIDHLPVIDLPEQEFKTPAITQAFNREDGRPGLLLTDPEALAELGSEWIAVIDAQSEVGLNISGQDMVPSEGGVVVVDYLADDAVGASVAALEAGKTGKVFLKLARADGTGTVYRLPIEVWAPVAQVSLSANPAIQLMDRVRAELVPSASECTFSVKASEAAKGNPYDSPSCFVEWTKWPVETKNISSGKTLSFEGPVEAVGTQAVEAAAYIVGADGGRHLIGTYTTSLEVTSVAGVVEMGPKYPFTEAYYMVEQLDIDFMQTVGPKCELTIVEFRAKNAAATNSTRPTCLVEWDEIPVGFKAREYWEKPYLLGSSTYLGNNDTKWTLSLFTKAGDKVEIGKGVFSFQSVMPPEIGVEFLENKSKIGDGYYTSYVSGQYVTDAQITAAGAKLMMTHNFNEGKEATEEVSPGYARSMDFRRRINTAPFDSLWEQREIKVETKYAQLQDIQSSGSIRVVSIPDANVLPVIQSDSQRILSTELLGVTVNVGDYYTSDVVYDAATMGEWEVRLVTKPTWNTVEPLTEWIKSDGTGAAEFELSVSELAGKSLRIYAEAKAISPIPEYQETRMSPRPLSIAILNGAALDGSIRALRLTGEAPLRVTLFADVNNRAWTKDLGDVKWEISTEGGAWEPMPNTSRTPQRIFRTFEKGSYKVRATMVNKNSGATSLTEEVEIIAYNVPRGLLRGPGNTFLNAESTFRLKSIDGSELDTSNIDVEWSFDRGVTWEAGGDSVTFSRDSEQRVYVYARMKYKDSPTEDPRIWKVLRSGVAFRKVRPPRVQLIGPRRPEVGKEAVWEANMLMPYPNMDLTMDGEFIMPHDGTVVPGQQVTYTPTDEDLDLEKTEISYRAWINGYRDQGGEGITTQRITFWLYDWPKWAIQPSFSSEYAPADLTLRVRNVGEFKGVEGVYYDWELPAHSGLDVVKDDNMALRLLKVNDPDTYTFRVHVYDARGNYSLVERAMVFKEPPPWQVTLAWSGSNTANRAPLDVMVRPYISGGHPKDTITSIVYRLDGEVIDTNGSRYARSTLGEEGQYQVTMDIETSMGKEAGGSADIEVKKNIPPTCELKVAEGGTAWTATARCVDEDGRIARHRWWLNDIEQGLGGAVITISKRTYSTPPHIILVGVDDSGDESPPLAW